MRGGAATVTFPSPGGPALEVTTMCCGKGSGIDMTLEPFPARVKAAVPLVTAGTPPPPALLP